MPGSICTIFGTLQHQFVLIKFITQSGATWRKLATCILLSMTAMGISASDIN